MAIASLTNISTDKYRGGAALSASAGLGTDLYTIIAKVNEIVAADGTSDTLAVGDGVESAEYYSGSASWFTVDGTNPPSLEKFRILDQTTGLFCTVTCSGGSLAVS